MKTKKPKHFKNMKSIPVEATGLPNKVKVGYKDIKIKYVRPDYKKWEMTDCFGAYDYRQNAAVQVSGLNQEKAALEKDEHEEAVVNQLTNVMMGVFRDNDWIVEMLKNDLNKTEHD